MIGKVYHIVNVLNDNFLLRNKKKGKNRIYLHAFDNIIPKR